MRTPESRPAGSSVITESGRSTPLNLPSGTLRLRADNSQRRHIQWADDVIDNEGMGKKSSKGTEFPLLSPERLADRI